jgi:hypothetical protein
MAAVGDRVIICAYGIFDGALDRGLWCGEGTMYMWYCIVKDCKGR